jgi:hypothetical protein
MNRTLLVCALALPCAAAANEKCVALDRGTIVYARADEDAKVGRTTARVIAYDEGGDATWRKVRVEKIESMGEDWIASARVTLFVDGARAAARCPRKSNVALLDLMRSYITLRWRDGGDAYTVRGTSVIDAAAGATDYVDRAGDKLVCFDPRTFGGLSIIVCGSCAKLAGFAGQSLGFRGKICP